MNTDINEYVVNEFESFNPIRDIELVKDRMMQVIDAESVRTKWQKSVVRTGSIFDGSHQALVVPTNLLGQHGALALQFAQKWPVQCMAYTKFCETKRDVKIRDRFGEMLCQPVTDSVLKYLLFMPTTRIPGEQSQIGYIASSMPTLCDMIQDLHITNIGIPALGCGVGGLDFQEVLDCMEDYLSEYVADCSISIYEPISQSD